MKVRRPLGIRTIDRDHKELLCGRMALLGLDRDAVTRADITLFARLKQRCDGCEFPTACAVDLRYDPSGQVWEAYCPNSSLLNGLTETL